MNASTSQDASAALFHIHTVFRIRCKPLRPPNPVSASFAFEAVRNDACAQRQRPAQLVCDDHAVQLALR